MNSTYNLHLGNWFSLQRSEMFIATGIPQQSRSFRSETRQQNLRRGRHCALRSSGVIKDRQAINISPLWGEETNHVLLHFQLEFASFLIRPLPNLSIDKDRSSSSGSVCGIVTRFC